MSPDPSRPIHDMMAVQPPRVDAAEGRFDKWLKGIDNGIDRFGPTLYQYWNGWSTATGLSGMSSANSPQRGTAPSAVP